MHLHVFVYPSMKPFPYFNQVIQDKLKEVIHKCAFMNKVIHVGTQAYIYVHILFKYNQT